MPPISPTKWDKIRGQPGVFRNDPLTRSGLHPRLPDSPVLNQRRRQLEDIEAAQYQQRFANADLPRTAFHFDPRHYEFNTFTESWRSSGHCRWLLRPALRASIYTFLLVGTFFILGCLNWAGLQQDHWTNLAPILSFDFTQFNASAKQISDHAVIRLFDESITDIAQQYHIYFTHWCATSTRATSTRGNGSEPPQWPARDSVWCRERHSGAADLLKEWHLGTNVSKLFQVDPTSGDFFDAYDEWMGPVTRLVGLATVCIAVVLVLDILRIIVRSWRAFVKHFFCSRQLDASPTKFLSIVRLWRAFVKDLFCSRQLDASPTKFRSTSAWTHRCLPDDCPYICGFDIYYCYDPLSFQYRSYLRDHDRYNNTEDASERYMAVKRQYLGYLEKSVAVRATQSVLALVCLLSVLLAVTFTTAIMAKVPGIRAEWVLSGIQIPKETLGFTGLGFALAFLLLLFGLTIVNVRLELDKYNHARDAGKPGTWPHWIPHMCQLLLAPVFWLLCACDVRLVRA